MNIYVFECTNHAGPSAAVVVAPDMESAHKLLEQGMGEDAPHYRWVCTSVQPTTRPAVVHLEYGWEG